jgi:hypothetical protein
MNDRERAAHADPAAAHTHTAKQQQHTNQVHRRLHLIDFLSKGSPPIYCKAGIKS